MNDFVAMGGYGSFVWPAYAVFVIVLIVDAVSPWLARRRVLAELRGRLRRRAARSGNVLETGRAMTPPAP